MHPQIGVNALHKTYSDLLKRYYLVGGMPEAVSAYSAGHDFAAVRKVQEEILLAYDNDFAKHAPPALLPKIRLLWGAIPSQLAKENKKLVYTALRPGARAREYESDFSRGELPPVAQARRACAGV